VLYSQLYGDLEILIDEIGVRIDDSAYAHNESGGRLNDTVHGCGNSLAPPGAAKPGERTEIRHPNRE
jgi:hypothetical protein